jgi:UPF0755 protein
LIKRLFFLLVLMAVVLSAWMLYFSHMPIPMRAESQEIDLKAGSSLKSVGQQLVDQGILNEPWSFVLMVRILGAAGNIKAGNYLIERGVTPYGLYVTFTEGSITQASITFIEGWNFKQVRAALDRNEGVRHMTMAYTDQQILAEIGAKETHPEGLFFPDTYYFSRGASDLDVLKRAYQTMQTKLTKAWQERESGLPYDSAYEALIMASIVEKETGKPSERPEIAGVFLNRLRIGMRLQTDPTVIYGMGDRFDGNLRKVDLIADTRYNTYTRAGLPPTPIAMPSLAAIEAALHPAKTKALYFVGKGDGSHVFSSTLVEHNRAVVKYQLRRSGNAR